MKILDAATKVLEDAGGPLEAKEIYDRICKEGLFEFKAKDPVSILRSSLRKHLKGRGPYRIEQVRTGVFKAK